MIPSAPAFCPPNSDGSLEKPAPKGYDKYRHLTKEVKEASKISKDFWLSLKNSSVWVMKPYKSGTREHLAPFPVELPERLIKAYTYIGEIVLDPFAGMGTTTKAALKNNRSVILYEINKDFFRPSEVNILVGNSEKINKDAGWKPEIGFRGLVKMMMETDLETIGRRKNL